MEIAGNTEKKKYFLFLCALCAPDGFNNQLAEPAYHS